MSLVFSVTFEVITADGEVDEAGFDIEAGTLREALEAVHETRTNEVDGVECIEANCSNLRQASWVTVHNSMEFRTGCRESRSIHFPPGITGASRVRLAKLVGAR